MPEVFVDTWAWVALAVRRDEHHAAASTQHAEFRRQKKQYVTSNFVIGEAITLLFQLLPHSQASRFVAAILTAAETGAYQCIHVSPEQFQQAWKLRQQLKDKPDVSFVDLTSMCIMDEMQITDVFTGDAHFRQVNRGYRLYPALS
jgi:predicted nucleic acid-binding protein